MKARRLLHRNTETIAGTVYGPIVVLSMLTAGAVCLTVSMSLRTARREDIHTGTSPVPLPAVLPEPLPSERLAF